MSSIRRRSAAAAALLAAGALAAGQQAALAAPARAAAPVLGTDAEGVIPGQYIVVLKGDKASLRAGTPKVLTRLTEDRKVRREFRTALRGFIASLDAAALKAVRNDPAVDFVEADRRISIAATQTDATWGLDRIDQRALPLNRTYTYTYTATGSGVTAYVIDTGIRGTHAEFGGRVGAGYSAISDGRGTTDCNGHGTHVAGTIGGRTYGVAKAVRLVPVRVLDCNGSGSNAGVIAGIDWVTANRSGPAVANMSLGGGASAALDAAVNRSIAAGVTYAVAAGNSGFFATGSPARVPAAITVGASTNTDQVASYSSFGRELDLFAPGSAITSAWITNDTATNTISGTSMATPHVAGVAALYLQGRPTATPAAVSSAIVGASTPNVLTGALQFFFGSPNKLLSSNVG